MNGFKTQRVKYTAAAVLSVILYPAPSFGMFRFTEPGTWNTCQAVMLLAMASLAMNFFLLFRLFLQARHKGIEIERRSGEARNESVLQFIGELKNRMKQEQEAARARETELMGEVRHWRDKYQEIAGRS